MLQIKDFLKKNNIKPIKYERSGDVTFISTNNKKLVVRKENIDNNVFNILKARNFNYYPKIIASDEDYILTEYIDELEIPFETKIQDLIDLMALLHNKTTFYKEINNDDIDSIYEDVNNNLLHLSGYYSDLMTVIESHIYMAPYEYTLARNISLVNYSIIKSKEYIDKWYEEVKKENMIRKVIIHNNLSVNNFLKNKDSYLVNWNKSKIDIPIFDVYKLYNKHFKDISFEEIMKRYEKDYKLLEHEKNLLYALLLMPDKVAFNNSVYNSTLKVTYMLDKIKDIRDYLTKES